MVTQNLYFHPKLELTKNENKVSRHIDFDPLITNMCILSAF